MAFLIGYFITNALIKHWRGIGAFILAFLVYQYLMMAFHYLASLL